MKESDGRNMKKKMGCGFGKFSSGLSFRPVKFPFEIIPRVIQFAHDGSWEERCASVAWRVVGAANPAALDL